MIEYIVGIILLGVGGFLVWESSVALSERKKRFRDGTHDYYDNPIDKEKDE